MTAQQRIASSCHVMIDGKPYWGDWRIGMSGKFKDAAAYIAWADNEIVESQRARGATNGMKTR